MLTRTGFQQDAKSVVIDVFGQKLDCPPCAYSTGSLGWVGKGGIQLPYGEHRLTCWLSVRITAIGSKIIPADNSCTLPPASTSAADGATWGNNRMLPLSRAGFRACAMPIPINVDAALVVLAPREFSSGSLGWNCEDVLEITVGSIAVRSLVEIDLVVNGSKRLAAATSEAAPAAPLTRSQFLNSAGPVSCYVHGRTITLNRQQFSTGTLGWFAQHGLYVDLDGQKLPCTAQLMIWVNDSSRVPQ